MKRHTQRARVDRQCVKNPHPEGIDVHFNVQDIDLVDRATGIVFYTTPFTPRGPERVFAFIRRHWLGFVNIHVADLRVMQHEYKLREEV